MRWLECVYGLLWGPPGVAVMVGTGLFLSLRTGFPQITLLPGAFRMLSVPKEKKGTVTQFQALCTALAATVGTGNIIGVSGAICLGGPGAIFWMWLCGFLGMATKFAEVTLARRYRDFSGGEMVGGPMYMIRKGMPGKWHFLAYLYSTFGVIAAFGVGNATQVNAVVSGFHDILASHGREPTWMGNLLVGIVMALAVGAVLFGGVKRIGAAAEKLVPAVSVGYILLCLWVLIKCRRQIPGAFAAILKGAVSPGAVTGGMIGSAFVSLRTGCARGIFTNEAGMGTASMAYAAAGEGHPVELGLLGLLEVFMDTIVICTLTAMAVLCGGAAIPYGVDAGGVLPFRVFSGVCGSWAAGALTLFLSVFAFATVLGWGLYGARCGQFLFGPGFWKTFVWLQMGGVLLGALLETRTLWLAAELVNGLMAVPNLIALTALSPELCRLVREYKKKYLRFENKKAIMKKKERRANYEKTAAVDSDAGAF